MLPNGEAGDLCVEGLPLPWMYVLFKPWPQKCLMFLSTVPLHTPESLQSLMLLLVFCYPWYPLCYPQDAPAGPSGPQKLPFSRPGSQPPWETLEAPLESTAALWRL